MVRVTLPFVDGSKDAQITRDYLAGTGCIHSDTGILFVVDKDGSKFAMFAPGCWVSGEVIEP